MPWYVSFQKGQGGLAPVHAQPAAGFVDVLFDGGFRQAQLDGDFLVGQEGRQSQAFFLTCAQALHSTLRYRRDSYGEKAATSSGEAGRTGLGPRREPIMKGGAA